MQKNITSTLTTPRKPLKKLTQLNEKEQFHFLELFNNHAFKVTEKVDGMAFRLYFNKDKMLFESSYSGLVEKDSFIFPDIANILDEMSKIKNLFKYPIKLSGELIWNYGIDENKNGSTFAPVCTKYTPSITFTGSYFVIFDMYKVEDDELILISDSEFKQNMLDISFTAEDEDAVQYINGKSLTYDFSDIKSKQFLNFIDLLKLFEIKTDSLQSHLCDVNVESPIEGVVITFDTGEQYGVFSSKYKSEKEKYYSFFKEAEDIEKNFKKVVYGYSLTSAIKKYNAHLTKDAKEKYSTNFLNCYYALVDKKDKIHSAVNNDIIPRTCGMFQEFLILKKAEKLMKNNYMSYIDPNLCDFNLSTQNYS